MAIKPRIIPTYLFNEHNEAYFYWHKSRHEGTLNKALDIYHVDAHNDMAKLQELRHSMYWNEGDDDNYLARHHHIAYHEMSIANFIIPAVLNDIIKNIYFIYPAWRNFTRHITRTNVATAFGEGKVFKHGIRFSEAEKTQCQFAYPDITPYSYIMTDVEQIPIKRKVILDIDLDYFACTDSITNRMSYELAITPDQYKNRENFYRENEDLRYSGLKIEFEKRRRNYFAIIRFQKLDNREYLPTETIIRQEIDKLVETLVEKMVQPVVITICRSCDSGYCPPDYFQMIEAYLLQQLRSGYPAISITN